jgi:cholesterol transport system auxiliary component
MTAVLIMLLTGCGGLPKVGPQAALYDFGIPSGETTATKQQLRLGTIEAAPGLEGGEMRYRLAYQNPARVFAYTESRWAAPPDRLLARRLEQRLLSAGVEQCTLYITLETFDQVFDTPDSSRGIVRLLASLALGKAHNLAAQTSIATEQAARSPDARGGVAALTAATDLAIAQLLTWAEAECPSSKYSLSHGR